MKRFDTWNKACEAANISYTESFRGGYESLWTKEEKANGYSDIDSHWPLYPEYDGSFDDYESIVLDQTSYFEEVMDLMTQEELLYKAEVCFALYVFFVQSK
jgi:hypothetical protein